MAIDQGAITIRDRDVTHLAPESVAWASYARTLLLNENASFPEENAIAGLPPVVL
jgi:hypothetical protein